MIAENSYLISTNKIEESKDNGKYLLVAREINQVGKETEDHAIIAINELRNDF